MLRQNNKQPIQLKSIADSLSYYSYIKEKKKQSVDALKSRLMIFQTKNDRMRVDETQKNMDRRGGKNNVKPKLCRLPVL